MNKDIKVGKAICRLPSLVSPAPSPHPLMWLVTGSAVRWRRIPPALSHTPSPCSLTLILYRAYHITLFFPLIHANSADISSANTNTLKAEQSSFTSAEWVFSAAERIPPASLVMAPHVCGCLLKLDQGVTAEVRVSSDGQCDQISSRKQANKLFEGERRCSMHYSALPALNFSLWGIVWHPRWIIKLWPFILIKGDAGGDFPPESGRSLDKLSGTALKSNASCCRASDASTTPKREICTCF